MRTLSNSSGFGPVLVMSVGFLLEESQETETIIGQHLIFNILVLLFRYRRYRHPLESLDLKVSPQGHGCMKIYNVMCFFNSFFLLFDFYRSLFSESIIED